MDNSENRTILILGGTGFLGQELGLVLVRAFPTCKLKVLTRSKISPMTTKASSEITNFSEKDDYKGANPFSLAVDPSEAIEPTLAMPSELKTWDGMRLKKSDIQNVDTIINLAGAPVLDRSWTGAQKKFILTSRLASVVAISDALKRYPNQVKTLIQASAIGYYGWRDDGIVKTEESPAGQDFLADVCQHWEEEATILSASIRVVIMRLGVVLGPTGGAFQSLQRIYNCGFGAILGNGAQWTNWIHVNDVGQFVSRSVEDWSLKGIYNLVSPGSVRQKDLHKALASCTRSFQHMRSPAAILNFVLGKRSEMFLQSPHVESIRLAEAGFTFKFDRIEAAIQDLLEDRPNRKNFYLLDRLWVPSPIESVWNFLWTSLAKSKVEEGDQIDLTLKFLWIKFKIKSNVVRLKKFHEIHLVSINGPFKSLSFKIEIDEIGGETLLGIKIFFQLPFFPFSSIIHPFVFKGFKKALNMRKFQVLSALNKINSTTD